MFFSLTSCFLTMKRSISDYPLHTAKLYELSECVDHVLLKLKKNYFLFSSFLFSFKTKLGRELCHNIRPEPYP